MDDSQRFDIPFNKPFIIGKELHYVSQSVLMGHISGDGPFTKRCQALLGERLGGSRVLLTTSLGAALEMAALLCEVAEGDEVVMPSFTGVAAANAFLMLGAKLRFADIRADTMNIDEAVLPALVGDRTRAVVVKHHGGIACAMAPIMELAHAHGLRVVEDCSEAIGASYQDRPLGTIGDLGALSFHETKDVICGEGGALITGDDALHERAEILREKGTNRSQFFRGQVDKYIWVDVGSSYVPSDLVAAFLYAQLENLNSIARERERLFRGYAERLEDLQRAGLLELPCIPEGCRPNYHNFHLRVRDRATRDALLAHFHGDGIMAVFHFVPLHVSRMGSKLGYREGMLPVTEEMAGRIVRLPFFYGLGQADMDRVCRTMSQFFGV